MLAEILVPSFEKVPQGVCMTTMVPTFCVRAWRTAGQASSSMAPWRCFVRWGRGELVQFLMCCYGTEDEEVEVTTHSKAADEQRWNRRASQREQYILQNGSRSRFKDYFYGDSTNPSGNLL